MILPSGYQASKAIALFLAKVRQRGIMKIPFYPRA